MIHVLAKIEVQPGKKEEFLTRFHAVMPLVHAEQGCLEYGPSVHITTPIEIQEPLSEETILVLEKWENVEALVTHLNAEHMNQFFSDTEKIVKKITLNVTEPA